MVFAVHETAGPRGFGSRQEPKAPVVMDSAGRHARERHQLAKRQRGSGAAVPGPRALVAAMACVMTARAIFFPGARFACARIRVPVSF